LQMGVEVLRSQLRQVILGNVALARLALEQADHQQAQLSRLYTAQESPAARRAFPALVAAILAARAALHAGDRVAISNALGTLQGTLDDLDLSLQSGGISSPWPAQLHAEAPSASAKSESPLVEKIADLYQRGRAYQAVVQSSLRLLSQA
jgi:hypothetical protein